MFYIYFIYVILLTTLNPIIRIKCKIKFINAQVTFKIKVYIIFLFR